MGIRSVVVVLVAVFVALLVYFNGAALSASPPAVWGPWVIEVPLGWLMLAALVLLGVLFLAYVASLQADRLLEHRRWSRELQQQRERAEQVEALRDAQAHTDLMAQLAQIRQLLEHRQGGAPVPPALPPQGGPPGPGVW